MSRLALSNHLSRCEPWSFPGVGNRREPGKVAGHLGPGPRCPATAVSCPADVSSWIVYPSGKVYVAAVRLERVVLTCELCRPWAEVRWTKDGEEVVESPALLLQKEDTVRRLVLPAVQLEDSGEYLCEIDDESASFTDTVTGVGPPPATAVIRGLP